MDPHSLSSGYDCLILLQFKIDWFKTINVEIIFFIEYKNVRLIMTVQGELFSCYLFCPPNSPKPGDIQIHDKTNINWLINKKVADFAWIF